MESNDNALRKEDVPLLLRLQRFRKVCLNQIPTEAGSKTVFGDISRNSFSSVLGADAKPQEVGVQWEVRR